MFSQAYYKESEIAAYKLLANNKIKALPIPVIDIANKLNIQVVGYNLGQEASGILVIDKNGGIIGYNPNDSYVRQRFTIGHELGHYMLHKNNNELFVDNFYLMKFRKHNSYKPLEYRQEQQANAFAAALLMPENLIEKELSQSSYSNLNETEVIEKVAKKCEVSITAMSFRLTNLNIFL